MRRPSKNFLSIFKKLFVLVNFGLIGKFVLLPLLLDNPPRLQLHDIMNYKIGDDNIFFIESKGAAFNRSGYLNSRQACSVESAAIKNPESGVYMVFVDVEELSTSKIMKTLSEYKNIRFLRLRLDEFALNTPVEDFIKSKKIKQGWVVENVSDFLRILVLWK